MKKVLAIIAIAGFMAACNNSGDNSGEKKDSTNQTMQGNKMGDSTKMAGDSTKMTTDSTKK